MSDLDGQNRRNEPEKYFLLKEGGVSEPHLPITSSPWTNGRSMVLTSQGETLWKELCQAGSNSRNKNKLLFEMKSH